MSVVTRYTTSAGVRSAGIIDIHYNTASDTFVEQTCRHVSVVTRYTISAGVRSAEIIDIHYNTVADLS